MKFALHNISLEVSDIHPHLQLGSPEQGIDDLTKDRMARGVSFVNRNKNKVRKDTKMDKE